MSSFSLSRATICIPGSGTTEQYGLGPSQHLTHHLGYGYRIRGGQCITHAGEPIISAPGGQGRYQTKLWYFRRPRKISEQALASALGGRRHNTALHHHYPHNCSGIPWWLSQPNIGRFALKCIIPDPKPKSSMHHCGARKRFTKPRPLEAHPHA